MAWKWRSVSSWRLCQSGWRGACVDTTDVASANRSARSLKPEAWSLISIQREHEQVAGTLQVVVLHRVHVTAAALDGHVLLRPDRIRHGRTFERRADVEAPENFEGLIVVRDEPSVLQRAEHQ